MFHPLRSGAAIGATLTVVGSVLLMAGPASATTPSISSFSPPAADVGSTVTIDGSGFTGATEVAFNYNSAPIVTDTDSQITATVPLANDDGPITVTTSAGTATSATTFTLLGFYVTTTSLPDAVRGEQYQVSLQAAGGTAPYRWSLTGGHLPRGLTLTRQGLLSGLLTTQRDKPGTYHLTVSVRDSTKRHHQRATGTLSLTVE